MIPLTPLPIERPRDWLARINRPQTAAEEMSIRKSIATGRPLGDERWRAIQSPRMGYVEPKPSGRPRKETGR